MPQVVAVERVGDAVGFSRLVERLAKRLHAITGLAGIRQAALSAIESGATTRIDLDVLDRLAMALAVDPAMLIGKD